MGVIGEAAGHGRARGSLVTEGHHDECWTDGSRWHCRPGCSAGAELRFEPLASRRAAGDAGHAPGCAHDHALETACATPSVSQDAALLRDLRDVGTGRIAHVYAGSCPNVFEEGVETERDRADPADECSACAVLMRADVALGDDAHEVALRRVEDARAELPEMLRRGYALDDGQVAIMLRVADALAAGVSMDAREALGRETRTALVVTPSKKSFGEVCADLGERLFAIGRGVERKHCHSLAAKRIREGGGYNSVAEQIANEIGRPLEFLAGALSTQGPDADLARVIAAWRGLDGVERRCVARNAENIARECWRETVAELFRRDGALVWTRIEFAPPPGVTVIGCDIDGEPATPEQWAKLRAAGVPVVEGVGV